MTERDPQYMYDYGDLADGRVTGWGLADIANELRTANMIALYATIGQPHDKSTRELFQAILERLKLSGEAHDGT